MAFDEEKKRILKLMKEKKCGEAICELAATCPEGMQRRGKIKSDRRLRARSGLNAHLSGQRIVFFDHSLYREKIIY